MRKHLVIITLFVVFLSTMAFAEPPAPFCKAKEYAVNMPMDDDGNYIWSFTKDSDGERVDYALVYLPQQKVIIIGRYPFSCGYIEDTGKIRCVMFMGYGYIEIDRSQEEMLGFCFSVFRELVSAGAI